MRLAAVVDVEAREGVEHHHADLAVEVTLAAMRLVGLASLEAANETNQIASVIACPRGKGRTPVAIADF